AAAEHDHALADLVDVAEGDRREPIDANMNVGRRLLAAGDVEIAATRRAATDEDRIPTLGQECFEAVDALAATKLGAEIEDVNPLRSGDGFGQTKARNLRAHHPAGLGILIEHDAVIAERGEITRDGERGGAAAHEGDALTVLGRRRLG